MNHGDVKKIVVLLVAASGDHEIFGAIIHPALRKKELEVVLILTNL